MTLLEKITSNISEWQEKVTEPAIALRAEIGDAKTMNDMAALVGEARGKQYFDSFRDQIGTFKNRESDLMVERQAEADTKSSESIFLIVFTALATIVVSIIFTWFIARNITRPINSVVTILKDILIGIKFSENPRG